MKSQRKRSILNVETIIVIVIAACMIFLNAFTTSKLAEMDRVASEAMFVVDGLEYAESEQFGQEIVKYRPDSAKMFEMYDSSLELLMSIQFDESTNLNDNNIHDYPELVELLKTSTEGQTSLEINGYEEEVYFQWITNSRNEQRLIIVYSTRAIVENVWIFSFVCYLVLILIFILLIRLHTKEYKEKVNQYKATTNTLKD